jgi:succinylglutamate desuccinylase
MNPEIQYVTAIHGNEQMPTLALATLGEFQTIGNPQALKKDVRFVDCDLNASFGVSGVLYEQRRAPQILAQLDAAKFTVDFHTFSHEMPPFAIVVDLKMLPLAASLGVDKVVYMKHNIKKGHALINYTSGVSVEVGTHRGQESFDLATSIVERLNTDGIRPQPLRVFEVYDRILEPGPYTNFVQAEDGIIPILYGEEVYIKQGFYGLKAREMTREKYV